MNSELRNWSDLRVFLGVLRAGSTLAASRALGMAQPTVARRVDALEHALGLTLFERDTRGFRPTEAAEALRPFAEEMEAASARLMVEVQALTCTRPIRISANTSNFSQRLTAILGDYADLHPEARFEFIPTPRPVDLMAGEADIALRVTRSAPDPDLICRKISTARFALFGAHRYFEINGKPASADDLAGHRFVTFDTGTFPGAFDAWLRARVAPEQIVQSFNELDLLHAAIRAGRGLGITNCRMMEGDPDLAPCFDPIPEFDADHLILISPQAYRREEVRAFTKFFAPRYAAIYR